MHFIIANLIKGRDGYRPDLPRSQFASASAFPRDQRALSVLPPDHRSIRSKRALRQLLKTRS